MKIFSPGWSHQPGLKELRQTTKFRSGTKAPLVQGPKMIETFVAGWKVVSLLVKLLYFFKKIDLMNKCAFATPFIY